MSSKSRARQKILINLSKTVENPLQFGEKALLEIHDWCIEQNTPFTIDDMVSMSAYLLNLKGLIRNDPIKCTSFILKKVRSNSTTLEPLYKPLAIQLVTEARYTRQQIIDKIIENFPTVKRETIGTFLSDCTTWKFSKIATQYGLIKKDGRNVLFFDNNTTRPVDQPAYHKLARRRM